MHESQAPPRTFGGPTPWRWQLLLGLLGIVALFVLIGRVRSLPSPSTSQVDVRPAPAVITAMRELERLETATFHMERVLEIADHQTDLFGLIKSKDALLLVAAGEVIAGVDLQGLPDDAAQVDSERRVVKLTLPAPKVFSTVLDNSATYVYARTTDSFALRKEDLEARAREAAEASMRQGAIDGGILTKAKINAERSIRSVLRTLGFAQVEIVWRTK